MRAVLTICLPLALFAACSSSSERAGEAPAHEASKQTDQCLDNPDLARAWGECNVKHTLYLESDAFAKCRAVSPGTEGTVNFELRVKTDGTVRRAKAAAPRSKLVSCLGRVMRKLQFAPPPQGKEATITVPYQLAP